MTATSFLIFNIRGINMRKFYYSGLYQPPFFRKHRIEYNKICACIGDTSYNLALLSNYYQDLIEDEDNEDRIREIIEESFVEALRGLVEDNGIRLGCIRHFSSSAILPFVDRCSRLSNEMTTSPYFLS